jgi:UDP-N-acetylglucosamine--N-acetylmuramyl-(pentapeptide) pyrophosphoryl-undecaprenol N-acetylglucosamine transferase
VSEVSLLGIPSIFVPLPNAQYNEQELLAQILADGKSAVIIQQDQLTKEIVLDTIDQMVKQYSEYYQHAQRIRQSPEITLHKDAGRTIVDHIESFSNNLRNSSY